MSKPWVVSLLSTDYDLKEYRESVISELKKHDIVLSAFELPDFPVEPTEHSHDSCLIALDRSDIALLIIDKRYGGIYYDSKDVSITETEYLAAVNKGKPALVFVAKKTWDERYKYNKNYKKSKKSKEDFDKEYKCNYVQNTKVIQFVDNVQLSYEKNGCSNWINFFTDIPDLLEKIQGKLKGLSRFYAQKIVESQIKDLSCRHTSTSLSMSLGDVFKRGYYIEPAYIIDSGELLLENEPLDDRIVETMNNFSSILVYGEAGYGKTTLLAKSFISHAEKYIEKKTYKIPFYLWLKKKNSSYHFNYIKYIDECFEENLKKSPYPFMDIDNLEPYFYLDGFDEIAEKLSEKEVCEIGYSEVFKYPILLTCRFQYALRYLNYSNFADKFNSRIKVETWNEDKAKDYIKNFCLARKKDTAYYDRINSLLESNQELYGILNNPLLITMLLWIIEQRRMYIPEMIRSSIDLFSECITELAKRELNRPGTENLSKDNIVLIWSYAAWIFYKNKMFKTKTKMSDLLEELHNHVLKDLGNGYNECLFEILFDTNGDIIFGTFHEQFLEFLVANLLLVSCLENKYPYPEYLKYVMRPEINRYFRAIWIESMSEKKAKVIENLQQQFYCCLGDNKNENVSMRVNAIYHISRFKFDNQNEIINRAFSIEKHISVRLSLFFGAIKMGRLDDEKEFFNLLTTSEEYNMSNRGYHLTYYSDMIIGDSLPFIDDEKVGWIGTLRAFQRHFESNKIEHYYLRRIDLVTMLHLIKSRNSMEPLTQDLLDHFSKLTYNPPFSDNIEFQTGIEEAFENVKEQCEYLNK
ncbi:DUF4062 domain-containing protein [Acetobacterium sp.]|uniref:DUF4062 domain-containing protein n=1 Tax=Acetobacterium sp. TaxID=1872094 RepID=UPI0035932D80